MFIATANVVHTIPPALRDRMEIISLSGYTMNEKLAIARGFLVPRQLESHGLEAGKIKFDDEGIKTIIEGYTREAGVRSLEREIGAICRKLARRVVQEKAKADVARRRRAWSARSSGGPSSGRGASSRSRRSASPPAWPGPRWAASCSRPKSA